MKIRFKRTLNIVVSVLVAALFIWFAVKNVELAEVGSHLQKVTFYWLPFFLIFVLVSHFLRAERWRLLLKDKDRQVSRSTLFAGVMMGYVFNNLIPRLGEIYRPVYVAKKEQMSSSNLIGTIVVERLFDIGTMFLMSVFAVFYLIGGRDAQMLRQMFGVENWSWYTVLLIPSLFIAIIAGVWLFYKTMGLLVAKNVYKNPVLIKILKIARSFGEGLVSIKNINNWPAFLLLTAGIWTAYSLMTWSTFFMLDLPGIFGLGITDAIVLTLVSSVGISLPTPAGIGSYHLLMQQSMWLLYEIPMTTAFTYATVAHAITVLAVFTIGPGAFWWDKYYTLKNVKENRIANNLERSKNPDSSGG